jgi:hypothetical protein
MTDCHVPHVFRMSCHPVPCQTHVSRECGLYHFFALCRQFKHPVIYHKTSRKMATAMRCVAMRPAALGRKVLSCYLTFTRWMQIRRCNISLKRAINLVILLIIKPKPVRTHLHSISL